MLNSTSFFRRGLYTLPILVVLGCSSKPQVREEIVIASIPTPVLTPPPEEGVSSAFHADENQTGDSDSERAQGLQTVRFAFDSSELDFESKEILNQNASLLKTKPSLSIQIEGHCDHKGSRGYNIALGERRAKEVLNHLVRLGIGRTRMTTVSFGKEKPLLDSDSEEADRKNRRANFVITGT